MPSFSAELRSRGHAVLCLFSALLLSACVGNEAQLADFVSGKFDKIVHEFEAEGGYAGLSDDGAGYGKHMVVCDAYFQMRVVAQFEDCYERLLPKPIPWWNESLSADIDPREKLRGQYLNYKAVIAIEVGDYDKAYALAQEAVPLIVKNADIHYGLVVYGYQNAGIAAALTGRPDKAREYVDLMSTVHASDYAMEKNLNDSRRSGRASIHMALRDYQAVVAAIEAEDDIATGAQVSRVFEALTSFGMSEIVGALVDTTLSDWQNLLTFPLNYMYAKGLYETGRVDEARTGFDKALASPLVANFGAIYYSILADRARIALRDGDVDKAIDLFKRAVEEVERRRKSLDTETSKIGFVGDKQAIYAELVVHLTRQGRAAEAFEYAERGKARALVDLLAQREDLPLVRPDQGQVANLLRELQMEEAATATPELSDQRPADRRSLSGVKAQLRERAPELASLVTVSTQGEADIRARLGPDEQLLEFFFRAGTDSVVAFAMSAEGTKAVELDGDGLPEDIRALRRALADPASDGWRGAAARLHDRLIAPLESELTAERLIVVPHGGLHYVPFAILGNGRDGDMLVDRFAMRLLPSASVMAFLDKDTSAESDLMILGNPDVGVPHLALPGAEAEANAIAGMWPDAELLIGRNATESAFKKQSDRFRVLHLASHGQFNPDEPLTSRMLLAPDGGNDGNLTVPEIYGLRLNADLVTLSACETGLGDVAGGDDVIGLTRGFLYAGAASIVASLWQVPDQPTQQLMTAFYENLRSGQDKSAALRDAQTALRLSFPHPVNWAAFQVTGGR